MEYEVAVLSPEDCGAYLTATALEDWRVNRIFPVHGSKVFILLHRERNLGEARAFSV